MATYRPLVNIPIQLQNSVTSVNLSGGTLEFYDAETSTAQTVFSDSTGTVLGTSVTLNSGGYPESGGNVITIWRDASKELKIVLKNAAGATVWTSDNIPADGVFDSASASKLSGIETGADVTDAANVGAVVNGKQALWVPASEMAPTATNGCSALTTVETTAGRPDLTGLNFDAATQEHAQWSWVPPPRWNDGVVTFRAYWTHEGGNTSGLDGVVWSLRAVALSADDSFDSDFGAEVEVGVDAAQAAEDLWVSSESGNITIAGNPGVNDLVVFQIARKTGATSPLDDLDVDAKLLGVVVYWTSDALTDA